MIIWWGTFICMAGAGTIVFHYGIQKAKRKSLRSMKSFEKPGEEWNPKKMKKYVKHAYFVIQECSLPRSILLLSFIFITTSDSILARL